MLETRGPGGWIYSPGVQVMRVSSQPSPKIERLWLHRKKRMPEWYKKIHKMLMDSIKKKGNGTYVIIKKKARENLPEILEVMNGVERGQFSNGPKSEMSRNAMWYAINTLSDTRNNQQTMISQVMHFLSVYGEYR